MSPLRTLKFREDCLGLGSVATDLRSFLSHDHIRAMRVPQHTGYFSDEASATRELQGPSADLRWMMFVHTLAVMQRYV